MNNTDAYLTRGQFPCVSSVILERHGDPISDMEGTNVSRLWQGLSIVWEDIRSNIAWRVGSGEKVNFWHDCWVSNLGPLITHVLSGRVPTCYTISVAAMVADNGEWKWVELEHLLLSHVLLHLAAIKCLLPSFTSDVVTWARTNLGIVTVKSAYAVWDGVTDGVETWLVLAKVKGWYETLAVGEECEDGCGPAGV
ncbi:hypothetical protein V6N13_108320 [Hibiscus sabdariffa]